MSPITGRFPLDIPSHPRQTRPHSLQGLLVHLIAQFVEEPPGQLEVVDAPGDGGVEGSVLPLILLAPGGYSPAPGGFIPPERKFKS
jgi:hypothetical protein